MLTICWMASSWPTIMRRRPLSSDCASLPVFPGSSWMLSRSILSPAFLTPRGAVCLGSPFHIAIGNPSSIPLDAPTLARILPRLLSLRHDLLDLCRSALGFRRSHFHPANQGPHRHLQEHLYNLCHILGPDFPIQTV